MKRLEENYLKALFVVFAILLLAGLFSFIFAVSMAIEKGDGLNYLFELIYMVLHLMILGVGTTFAIATLKLKKGSQIMKSLMIIPNTTVRSRPATIIASVLSFLGFGTGIYFLLILFGLDLPHFTFPIALILILVNVSFTIFLVGLFFVFYPTVFHKCLKEENL